MTHIGQELYPNMVFRDATSAFESTFMMIMQHGVVLENNTKACFNLGFYILNPWHRIITTEWRKFSKTYAEREWNWYLSQNRSVEELKKYAPIWDRMHGGDNIVNSNYGWQWNRNDQLEKCIEQLQRDKNTRQAWLTIFDGKEKDNFAFDTPCTLNVGFYIQNEDLHMTVLMRSNDLYYGFCNDQYCFSKLQEYVANKLNLNMGTYFHFAHNMHIYKEHWNKNPYIKL